VVASWSRVRCPRRRLARPRRTRREWRALRRATGARDSRRRSCPTPPGGGPDRFDDLVVARTPAEVAEHPLTDLVVGRLRIRVEERLGRQDITGSANAEQKTAVVDEGLRD